MFPILATNFGWILEWVNLIFTILYAFIVWGWALYIIGLSGLQIFNVWGEQWVKARKATMISSMMYLFLSFCVVSIIFGIISISWLWDTANSGKNSVNTYLEWSLEQIENRSYEWDVFESDEDFSWNSNFDDPLNLDF